MINEHDIKDMWPGGNPNKEKGQIELDPFGKNSNEPGAKLDNGKSAVHQGIFDYFPRALLAVADVSTKGAEKYSWKGFESVPNGINRYLNAGGRHLINQSIEGPYDPDGFRHLAQVCWNYLAALELTLRNEDVVK
jgi:hypothetical protein